MGEYKLSHSTNIRGMCASMSIDKVTRSLGRLEQKIYRQPMYHVPGQKYLYVFGVTKKDKTFCDGPFIPGDPEVDRTLSKLNDGEIFELNTSNLARATREIKAELLRRDGDPDEVLKKMLHKKGLAKELEREEKPQRRRLRFLPARRHT